MYNKCLLFVSLLLVCLSSTQASVQIKISDAASVWWLAVLPQNDGQATSMIEVKDSLSTSFSPMTSNGPDWSYFTSSPPAGRGFSAPLTLRITASSGVQISVNVPSITPGQLIDTGASFSSVLNPTTAPAAQATARPTSTPPSQVSFRPTPAPTPSVVTPSVVTPSPTTKAPPTGATTRPVTTAPTLAPTTAPTPAPTASNSGTCGVTSNTIEPVKLLVPLYVYPGAAWDTVIASANAGVHVIAIINPSSGPLQLVDGAYSTYMTKSKNAGVEMVGYVHTSYGSRPIEDVKADIDTYVSKYPLVTGIFLDEAASDPTQLSYYSQAYNYVMAKYGYKHTILNPGVVPDQGYLAISTNIVIYEDYASSINKVDSYPSWVKCAPSTAQKSGYKYKFSGVVHTTSLGEQATVVSRLSSAGVGLVYVTDGLGGCCTYNSLTSYLPAEATSIMRINS